MEYFTDPEPQPEIFHISLQNASATSLTIDWNLRWNASCINQSLIIAYYGQLFNCTNPDLSGRRNLRHDTICEIGLISNISQVIDYNTSSLMIGALLPNSTYNIKVQIQSQGCKNMIFKAEAVFHTLQFSKYNSVVLLS